MSARTPFDTLAPEFSVRVNGDALPAEAAADLIRLSVLDDVDAPGMFTVTLGAWDTQQMKPKWIDHALFSVGHPLDIAFGYRDTTSVLLSGEITGLEAEFPRARAPTLTVRGHDRRHRLMRARKTRSYTNSKDSDIASQVAADAGLNPRVDDSGVMLPYVLQHNQTDLEFLLMRARRINFEVMVQDRDLLFRPRQTATQPVLTLHREIELMEFYPRLSTLRQVSQLEVRGWDPAQKKEIVGRAVPGDAPQAMSGASAATSGPSATQRAFDPGSSARVCTPVQSQDEADAMARRAFGEIALGYVHADGICIGEPRLRAGAVVTIDGVGERFSGPYYITSVEHAFTPARGYRTSFSARRNAS